MKEHYLKTSELFFSKENYKITTVLGSCVAVCLWDNILKFGGINHYLLPKWDGRNGESIKYGDISLKKLLNEFNKAGSNKKNIQAKIFGGAKILNDNLNIGEKNIEIAFEILKQNNIPVTSSDTGGLNARKIIYYNFNNKIDLITINKIL